jgi:hypothetical protein
MELLEYMVSVQFGPDAEIRSKLIEVKEMVMSRIIGPGLRKGLLAALDRMIDEMTPKAKSKKTRADLDDEIPF